MSAGAACSYVKCKFIHGDSRRKSWRFFLKALSPMFCNSIRNKGIGNLVYF